MVKTWEYEVWSKFLVQEEKKGKELRLKVLGLRLYCVGLVFDKIP